MENGDGVAVVGNHDILIATVGRVRELTSVVGVYFFGGLHTYVDFA